MCAATNEYNGRITMKRHLIATALTSLLLLGGSVAAIAQPTASFAHSAHSIGDTLVGDWYNVNAATHSIPRITITPAGSAFTAHTYGACVPTNCDWGSAPLVLGSFYAKDQYSFSFATKRETIQRFGSDLRVVTATHFTDGSGRADYRTVDYFFQAPSFVPGIYVNVDATTGGLTRMVLGQNADGSYNVHPYGRCEPSDCDWGSANTSFSSATTAATSFAFSFKTSAVTLSSSGDLLRAQVVNHFTDGSGRADYTGVYYFRLPTGTWVNNDAATRDITRIQIEQQSDGSLTAHAYGACEPSDCDWNAVPMVLSGDTYVATFHFGFATTTVTLTPGDPTLQVEDATHFTDGSGRADLDIVSQFHRI